jgi:hypothetical protein
VSCNLENVLQNGFVETLSDLKSHGELGAVVYLADCVELMRLMPVSCVDMVFADPPYRLSGGGVTVRSGRVAPVDKGEWDRSRGFKSASLCQRPLNIPTTLFLNGKKTAFDM